MLVHREPEHLNELTSHSVYKQQWYDISEQEPSHINNDTTEKCNIDSIEGWVCGDCNIQ